MTNLDRPESLHEDGYPTEEALDYLDAFPGTAREMVDYVEDLMTAFYGGCRVKEIIDDLKQPVTEVSFFTSGWSGCEEIMGRSSKTMLHNMYWESSSRGGLTVYRIPADVGDTAGIWGLPSLMNQAETENKLTGFHDDIVTVVEEKWNRWYWQIIRADGEPVNLFVAAENGSGKTEEAAVVAAEAARELTAAAIERGETVLDPEPSNHRAAVAAGARAIFELECGPSGWKYEDQSAKDIARWELQSAVAATAALRELRSRQAKATEPAKASNFNVHLSKTTARALRHDPELFGLKLEDGGWADVSDLIVGLRAHSAQWASLSTLDLHKMVTAQLKPRFEMGRGRIRALHGHSTAGSFASPASTPPKILFHGTDSEAAEAILTTGLKPMRRQHVHLSVDRETAVKVGLRKADDPVILEVEATEAAAAGVLFRQTSANVWLSDFIPEEFIWVAAD